MDELSKQMKAMDTKFAKTTTALFEALAKQATPTSSKNKLDTSNQGNLNKTGDSKLTLQHLNEVDRLKARETDNLGKDV